jgi:hypothetical protein
MLNLFSNGEILLEGWPFTSPVPRQVKSCEARYRQGEHSFSQKLRERAKV